MLRFDAGYDRNLGQATLADEIVSGQFQHEFLGYFRIKL